MSKQNSSLIPQPISTPLSTDEATHLDALSLGVQLAQGREPDEVLNLLANEFRTKIVSVGGKVDELDLPIAYGSFDELDEDGDSDVLKVFPSHYADCHFRVRKNYDWLSLSSFVDLCATDWHNSDSFALGGLRNLISIPCAPLSQTFCAELGHLLCDIAQQLALIKPDSQAA